MMHLRRRPLVIGLIVLLLALAGGTAFAATRLPPRTAPVSSTPIFITRIVLQGTPPANGVGATKTTDEGLAITLVQIVKHGPRWLFQFQIRNMASNSLTIRGTHQEHQFVVAGNSGAAPPNNIGYAQLSSPSANEIATSYSDLASTLQAGEMTQG